MKVLHQLLLLLLRQLTGRHPGNIVQLFGRSHKMPLNHHFLQLPT
jgi:hypothetical protein